MLRRSLFKSAGLLAGAAAFGSAVPAASAADAKVFVPSEKTPLLLNFNENSLGMSPKAKAAVADAVNGAFRYPDALREELQAEIAKTLGVKTDNVSLGNGSSETIQAVVQSVAEKARRAGKPVQLIVPDPTFGCAEGYADAVGMAVVKVPLTGPKLAFDLDAMKKAARNFKGISLVYACNPNNPTATVTPSALLEAWVKEAGPDVVFLFDEAYAEFVTDPAFVSAVELVKAGVPNVVVARTFSKIFAMAGLRIGYAVAAKDTCAAVDGFASVDNINAAGAAAGIASLRDKVFIEKSKASVELSRAIVVKALTELGLEYLPSQANFIFHKIKGEHKLYKSRMAEAHVFVGREFPPAVGWNRLTLGTPEEMKAFVKVLKDFRAKGWI